jgi:hypothetical protein
VHVPADVAASWDRGTRYLPVAPEEFERLVSLASLEPDRPSQLPARLVAAEYTAELASPDTLRGRAKLTVQFDGSTPTLLPVVPLGLAVHDARWVEDARPAVLGLAEDGLPCLLVESSGVLEVDWSLRGQMAESGLALVLAVPVCPQRSLSLTLPPALVPKAAQPCVLEQQAGGRWNLRWSTADPLALQLAPADRPEPEPVVQARPRLIYQVSPRGLEVTVEISLDVQGAPLRTLGCQIDPPLRLVTARLGDGVLPWSRPQPTNAEEGPGQVVVAFPQPLLGSGVVRLTAVGAARPLGQKERLPAIRPQGVFWREGGATLRIDPALRLRQLEVTDGRQSSALAGDEVQVQFFTPQAAIHLALALHEPAATLQSVHSLQLGDTEVTGRVAAELVSSGGAVFSLRAAIHPDWNIEAVETQPPGGAIDWRITGTAPQQELVVRLDEPPPGQTPPVIVVRGRRLALPAEAPFDLSALLMLRWLGPGRQKILLEFPSAPARPLRFGAGERIRRVELRQIEPALARLFPTAPSGTVLELDPDGSRLAIARELQTPRFQADALVEATVAGELLHESYLARITPEAVRLGSFYVQFSQPREAPLDWRLGSSRELSARRLGAQEQADAGFPPEGEVWHVTLDRPREEPFEVFAARSTPRGELMPVSLPSLVGADQQRGELRIRSQGGAALAIQTTRLATSAGPAERRDPALRAVFEFSPARDASPSLPAAITLATQTAALPSSWGLVWRAAVHSDLEPAGAARHTAIYWVENFGLDRATLRLPEGARLSELRVNDLPATWTGGGRLVEVPLPPDQRFVTLECQFHSNEGPLGAWSRRQCPLPAIDLAVIDAAWLVRVPSGYAAVTGQGSAIPVDATAGQIAVQGISPLAPAPAGTHWFYRLLGPLSRSPNQRAFHPLKADDWRSLWKSVLPTASPGSAAGSHIERAGGGLNQGSSGVGRRGDDALAAAVLPADSPYWRGKSPASLPSWNSFAFGVGSAGETSVRVYALSRFESAGWMAALVLALACGWFFPRRLAAWILLAAALALAALLVPEELVPVTSKLLPGLLAGAALALPPVRPATAARARRSAGTSSRRRIVVSAAGALLIAAWACAQEAPPSKNVHSVIIPMDKEGGLSRYYFVPDVLFAELDRRVARARREPRTWLVQKARYTAVLREAMPRPATLELTAAIDFHAFGPRQRIKLELGAIDPALRPATGILDSDPIALTWENNGQVLAFDVLQPGPHRLEFTFLATVQPGPDGPQMDLTIPPIPDSQIELSTPLSTGRMEVVSARGQMGQSGGHQQAYLGPSGRLQLRWSEGAQRTPNLDVQELLWLHVKPGSVVLEARLACAVRQGNVRAVALQIDPQLRLLPLNDPNVSAVRTLPEGSGGAARSVEFELARPAAEPFTLSASFLLNQSSGVGHTSLPRIELTDARVTSRQLAVSVDAALDYAQTAAEGMTAIPVGDFLAGWGSAAGFPRFAYKLPADLPPWVLATRPRAPDTTSDQTCAWTLSLRRADLDFSAVVEVAGLAFQHRITAPPELHLDRISVVDLRQNSTRPEKSARERAADWSRDETGAIVVRLSEPAGARQLVQVQGWLPIPRAGRWQPPWLRLHEGVVRSSSVEIYRRPDLIVKLDAQAGLNVAEVTQLRAVSPPGEAAASRTLASTAPSAPAATAASSAPDTPAGRLVARLSSLTAAGLPTLTLQANEPRVRSEQVAFLRRTGAQWRLDVEVFLQVVGGLLDSLAFEVPKDEAAGLTFDQPGQIDRMDLTTPARQLVTFTPAEPIAGSYRLRASLPCRPPGSEARALPEMRLVERGAGRRFVVLPMRGAGRAIVWETRGLVRGRLPAGLQLDGEIPAGSEVYRVAAASYRAEMRLGDDRSDPPRVPLAELRLAARPEENLLAAATFDLQPAGRSYLTLELPSPCSLLWVSESQRGVVAVQESPGRWRVLLPSARLPQRLEVWYAVPLSAAGPKTSIPLPSLPEFRIQRWVYTRSQASGVSAAGVLPVGAEAPRSERAAASTEPPRAAPGWHPLTPAQLALVRAETAAGQIAVAAEVATASELRDGYRRWAQRLATNLAAAAAAARQPNTPPAARREILARCARLAAEQDQQAEAIGARDVWDALTAERSPSSADQTEVWHEALGPDAAAVQTAGEGPLMELLVASGSGPLWRQWLLQRGLAGGVVLILLPLSLLLARRWRGGDIAARWPHWIVVAGGLVWWLFLAPSALGWLIVGWGLASSIRK